MSGNLRLISNALLLILFAFPILPYGIRSIGLIVWAIVSIVLFLLNRKSFIATAIDKRTLWTLLLPYILLIISLIYSEDIKKGGDLIVRMIPLFLCPVIFFLTKQFLTDKLFHYAKLTFVSSVILLTLFTSYKVYDAREYLDRPLTPKELEYNGVTRETITTEKTTEIKYRRFKVFAEEASGTHSTYFGIYIILCIFIIGEIVLDKNQYSTLRFAIGTVGFLLFVWLAVMSVRAPLVAMIVSVFAVTLIKLKDLRTVLGLLFSTVAVCSVLYFSVPALKIRVDEVFINKLDLPKSGKDAAAFNSTNVRLGSLYCSWEIVKSDFLTGVGVGDVQDRLDDCYQTKIGAVIYTWDTYNSHNQYLFFVLASGIACLVLFLFQIIYMVVLSYKRKNGLGLFFFVSIALIFLSENILVRSDGIMYFALLSSFIIFHKTSQK